MASEAHITPVILRQLWIAQKIEFINPIFSQPEFQLDLAEIKEAIREVHFQFGPHMENDTRPVMPSRQKSYKRLTRLLERFHAVPAGLAESIRLLYPDEEFSSRMKLKLQEAGWDPEKITDPRLSTIERRLEGMELLAPQQAYDGLGLLDLGHSTGAVTDDSSEGEGVIKDENEDEDSDESADDDGDSPDPHPTTPDQRQSQPDQQQSQPDQQQSQPDQQQSQPDQQQSQPDQPQISQSAAHTSRQVSPERHKKPETEVKTEPGAAQPPASTPPAATPETPSANATEQGKQEAKKFKKEGSVKRPRSPSPSMGDIPRLADSQRETPASTRALARQVRRTPSIEPEYDLTIDSPVAPTSPTTIAQLARAKKRREAKEQLRRRNSLRKHGQGANDPVDLT